MAALNLRGSHPGLPALPTVLGRVYLKKQETRCRKLCYSILSILKIGYQVTEWLLCGTCRLGHRLADELADTVRQAGAIADPVVDAVTLELERGG